MKTVFLSLAAMIMILVASCDKAEETPSSTVDSTLNKKSAVITLTPEEFADRFGWYVGFLGKTKELNVRYDFSRKLFEVSEDDDIDFPHSTVECSGNGISFVNCVKDWLEDNPGDGLCICHDNDGYEASSGGDC